MKYAADFRRIAREALCGKWPIAVLTGFIASLLGGGIANSGGGSSSSNSNDTSSKFFEKVQVSEELLLTLVGIAFAVAVVSLIWLIVTIIIGGAAKLGYATFNLKLVDHKEVALSDLFSQFHRLGAGFCMNFFMGLFIILWSLLLFIPGIIKAFSYSMTPYILAENPDMTATEAITRSRQVMDGNKWRLFCLGFSFIGWDLLCALPTFLAIIVVVVGIMTTGNIVLLLLIIPFALITFVGSLFLYPYKEAAYAAFYRDVAGLPAQVYEEASDIY